MDRFYNRILDDKVELWTVERILKEFNLDAVDLAKWDCEGGEVEAFKSMSDDAASRFQFMVGEYHIWDENGRYLKPDIVDCMKFWRAVQRKFPRLMFKYQHKALGLFQAWPREACNDVIGNKIRCAG